MAQWRLTKAENYISALHKTSAYRRIQMSPVSAGNGNPSEKGKQVSTAQSETPIPQETADGSGKNLTDTGNLCSGNEGGVRFKLNHAKAETELIVIDCRRPERRSSDEDFQFSTTDTRSI